MRSAPCGSGWVPPHGSVGRVASQLGRGKALARLWVGQALIEEGQLPGRTSQDAARVHRESVNLMWPQGGGLMWAPVGSNRGGLRGRAGLMALERRAGADQCDRRPRRRRRPQLARGLSVPRGRTSGPDPNGR